MHLERKKNRRFIDSTRKQLLDLIAVLDAGRTNCGDLSVLQNELIDIKIANCRLQLIRVDGLEAIYERDGQIDPAQDSVPHGGTGTGERDD